jgi:ATP-binding protein involved in chromosome partitioning
MAAAVPTRIYQAGPATLAILWSDGRERRYAVRDLRLACPCANCRDEMTGERILDPARVPEDVLPVHLGSVGNYGLKIRWSDGHDTGIYSFDRLRELGDST